MTIAGLQRKELVRKVRSALANDLPPDLQAAFNERAATAEVDGGLNREAVERLGQQEVTSGSAGDDVTAWRSWMHSRYAVWRTSGLSRSEAMRSVWSEAEGISHLR